LPSAESLNGEKGRWTEIESVLLVEDHLVYGNVSLLLC
jgi:hypothetical protein